MQSRRLGLICWKRRLASIAIVATGICAGGGIFAQTPVADAPQRGAVDAQSIAQLERNLSGSVLVGNFTVTGRNDDAPPRLISERYELSAVKHLKGDDWLFQTRITYGEHDLKIPLTLPVKWAGDTPIITVDNMPFPGIGTYTARVMIYRDHYAGFWTGADHGGHLFGVVRRQDQEQSPQQDVVESAETE